MEAPAHDGFVPQTRAVPKSLPVDRPSSDAAERFTSLVKLLTFYFSSANLSKDRWMRHQLDACDGKLSIESFHKFNRVKLLHPTTQNIIDALKQVPTVELVDSKTIKLKSVLPAMEKENEAVIYVERFGKQTIDSLKAQFETVGKVQFVRLPTWPNGEIKGYAFIDYEKMEEAEKAVEKFNTYPDGMKVMLRSSWIELRDEYKELIKTQHETLRGNRKSKSLSEHFPPGVLVHVVGIGASPKPNAHTVKSIMQTFGRVAYVDYTVDLNEAIVRYTSADAATRAADGLNNEEEKLGGQYVKAAVLTGDMETVYWEEVMKKRQKRKEERPVKNAPSEPKKKTAKRPAQTVSFDSDGEEEAPKAVEVLPEKKETPPEEAPESKDNAEADAEADGSKKRKRRRGARGGKKKKEEGEGAE